MTQYLLLRALSRLHARYSRDLELFLKQEEDATFPLWMSTDRRFTARSMLQARRDVVADLLQELCAEDPVDLKS